VSDDSATREFEPTQKKLDDARDEGDVARSPDLAAAAAYLGLALVLVTAGGGLVAASTEVLAGTLARAVDLGASLNGSGGRRLAVEIAGAALLPLVPLLLGPAMAVTLVLIAQRAIVLAPSRLEMKLSRISPIAALGQRFGPSGLVEFAKSVIKLTLFSTAVIAATLAHLDPILGALSAEPGQVAALMGREVVYLLGWVAAISVAIAVPDTLWQRYDHRRKLRMSRTEVLDEQKSTEGDPHLKQERRRRGMDIATQRMLLDVPTADVVIVNPEHYAVALAWDRAVGGAPRCVAKGVDEVAARIRATAEAAGVPLHRDPATARALHATVEIGTEIRPEHYRAVAAAIRYAERIRALARKRP
jgi:flagellar biosynthetic protein FlhB